MKEVLKSRGLLSVRVAAQEARGFRQRITHGLFGIAANRSIDGKKENSYV